MGHKQRFIFPGDLYFGRDGMLLKTVLGSCVAITLWHPAHALGGMCHYTLPSRPRGNNGVLDGCYGDEALKIFLEHIKLNHTDPAEYIVGVYGGANMFPAQKRHVTDDVGARNIKTAIRLLGRHGFLIAERYVGGSRSLRVRFDLASGSVHFESIDMDANVECMT